MGPVYIRKRVKCFCQYCLKDFMAVNAKATACSDEECQRQKRNYYAAISRERKKKK